MHATTAWRAPAVPGPERCAEAATQRRHGWCQRCYGRENATCVKKKRNRSRHRELFKCPTRGTHADACSWRSGQLRKSPDSREVKALHDATHPFTGLRWCHWQHLLFRQLQMLLLGPRPHVQRVFLRWSEVDHSNLWPVFAWSRVKKGLNCNLAKKGTTPDRTICNLVSYGTNTFHTNCNIEFK